MGSSSKGCSPFCIPWEALNPLSFLLPLKREEGIAVDERQIWDAIKADYMSEEMSVREIAEKYGKSQQQIYRRASKEGWQKLRQKIAEKADEKYVTRMAGARARELEAVTTAAGKMSRLLDKTVEALDQKPTDEVIKSLKGLSALASAITSTTEALMKLHGIQTPAQLQAQKIATQRLALDKRKQKFVESKVAEENRDKEIALSITVRKPPDKPVVEDAEGAEDGEEN